VSAYNKLPRFRRCCHHSRCRRRRSSWHWCSDCRLDTFDDHSGTCD